MDLPILRYGVGRSHVQPPSNLPCGTIARAGGGWPPWQMQAMRRKRYLSTTGDCRGGKKSLLNLAVGGHQLGKFVPCLGLRRSRGGAKPPKMWATASLTACAQTGMGWQVARVSAVTLE